MKSILAAVLVLCAVVCALGQQPVVTGIMVAPAMSSAAAAGQKVVISGRNFGVTGQPISVMIGTFSCIHIQRISAQEITCTVNGYGANQQVIVTVAGVASADIASAPGAAPAVRFDFANPMTPGLSCVPPFGAADVINGEMCNCWSSYAPSTPLATDCNTHAVCAGRVTSPSSVAQYIPAAPVTSFANDVLTITQSAPIVQGRRDTIIQFVVPNIGQATGPAAGTVGEETCFYPGNIWTKSVSQLDCLDVYTATMPWSQNSMCGFIEDMSAVGTPVHMYRTVLQTTYTETYMNANNMLSFRKMSHTYMMAVSFERQIVAMTQTAITVELAPPTVDVEIISDAVYDVASQTTLISFRTISDWPWTLNQSTLASQWVSSNNALLALASAPATTLDSAPACTNDVDSDCEQIWDLVITAGSVCDLNGQITFANPQLGCRDVANGDCASIPAISFVIAIGHTDLCDSASADASSGLTATLNSFEDEEFTLGQTAFQVGEMVYFQLTVTDPTSTIDNAIMSSITAAAAGAAQTALFPAATSNLAQLAVTSNASMIAPGQPATLTFQFRLSRAIQALAGFQMSEQLTITATVDLYYHGNQKRSVQMSSVASTTHAQLAIYETEEAAAEVAQSPANELTEEFSLFSSASTVMTSFAVIACAAVMMM